MAEKNSNVSYSFKRCGGCEALGASCAACDHNKAQMKILHGIATRRGQGLDAAFKQLRAARGTTVEQIVAYGRQLVWREKNIDAGREAMLARFGWVDASDEERKKVLLVFESFLDELEGGQWRPEPTAAFESFLSDIDMSDGQREAVKAFWEKLTDVERDTFWDRIVLLSDSSKLLAIGYCMTGGGAACVDEIVFGERMG